MFKADEASVAEARGEKASSATRLGALMAFTREVIRERGHISADVLQSFFDAGFTKAQALEVVANIGLKTISNFIDGFAHVQLDSQFEAHQWVPAHAH
jgi:alkylhydroperoxidase family enzyme